MSNSRLTACAASLLVIVFVACGGGDGKTETEAPAKTKAAAAPAAGSGVINGVVNYGNGDPDTEISMKADPQCAALHKGKKVTTETVVADGGKLANVFVYVKEGLSGTYKAPADSKLLNQEGCQYKPHVSGIMTGQKLVIRNSDNTLHNVHALPKKNKEFNQGQPFKDMELEKKFTTPEVMVRFKCDVHPWMGAYIGVVDHPFYAVSGSDGSFEIDGLPAGEYVLEAWHETLGTQTKTVTVAEDSAAAVSFDFAASAS